MRAGDVATIAPNYAPLREALFLFCSMNSYTATEGCNKEESPGKKGEASRFPGHIYGGENVGRVSQYWLLGGGLFWDTGDLHNVGAEPQTSTHGDTSILPSGAGGLVTTIKECLRAGLKGNICSDFFFFLSITIIIITVIIIFIIIMNTVSHLSTQKNKPIHSLSGDANMVALTRTSFCPSPMCPSFILHSATAAIQGFLLIQADYFKMCTRARTWSQK